MERQNQSLDSADKAMTEKDILLRVDNVSRTYQTPGGDVHALQNVCIDIPRGSLIALKGALKGRSGSGKTTLLNIIGGLDRPTVGEVIFNDQRLGDLDDEALINLRCEQIGFVFQSFALLPTFSAFENVEFALRLADRSVRYSQSRALQCLKVVGLANRRDSRPDELSGGQQQRVAIARALAHHPALILADEPTGELDTSTALTIYNLLKEVSQTFDTTIVIVSHDTNVWKHVDRVVAI
ncbi:MAG: ABC transporter ATP-binding protein, partial [Spirochaetota bacterium]|nr:ABC transporter ATP-binding protein [Spirochaetota bacterium]